MERPKKLKRPISEEPEILTIRDKGVVCQLERIETLLECILATMEAKISLWQRLKRWLFG